MEVQEYKHDPESNFECLVHQVEEQAEFCDVTVTMGDWRKRFHRCVLTASFLFRSVIETQIANPKTDSDDGKTDRIHDTKLEIKIDTSPDIVEMAIMFMYGRVPAFTITNIGGLLELAEYLKMKELRHACVDWFNSVDYSEINFIYVLKLSKKYDFEIPACIQYIESHIPETFLHTEAADLPRDLVQSFFTDERFSYVQMDEKLNFLVHLSNRYTTDSAKDFVIKLFKTLELSEVTPLVWENAKKDAKFNMIFHLENKVRHTYQESSRKCVMIMSDETKFVCLDLYDNRWYRLTSSYYERYPADEFQDDIAGVRNNNPEVYFKGLEFGFYEENEEHLITVDLDSDEIHEYTIQLEYYDVPNAEIDHMNITHSIINNDTVVAIVEKTIQMYGDSNSSESESEFFGSNHQDQNQNEMNYVRQPQHSPGLIQDASTSTIHTTGTSIDCSIFKKDRNDRITFTSVYVGETSHQDIEVCSLFSLRKENVTEISMNNGSVLALLTESGKDMHLILYDLLECKMERVLTLHEGKYEISPMENGFVLHNHSQCYCITKDTVPSVSGSYKVQKIMLENRKDWFVKYRFQGGVWIRVLRRSMDSDIKLQFIFHEELAATYSSFDMDWRSLSMPKYKTLFENVKNLTNVFIVPLSKRKLRCNIECPHCRFSDEVDFF